MFVIAFAVRVALAVIFSSEWPVGSSKAYRVGLAEGILSGQEFAFDGVQNIYQTPVYPMFLAAIFAVLGNHWWSIALVQIALDALSAVTISRIGVKLSANGWWAGLVYALYPYAAMQSRAIIDTPLIVAFFALAIDQYLTFLQHGRKRNLIVASLLVGLGTLNRPTCGVITIAFVGALIVSKLRPKRACGYAILSLGLAAAAPFIWAMRNYNLTGEFPVLAIGGQHAMWYAHNEHIHDVYLRMESPDRVGRDQRYPMHPNIKTSDFFRVSPRDQLDLGKQCSQAVRSWVHLNPYQVLDYTLLKLRRFISCDYVIQEADVPFIQLRRWVHIVTAAPISVLGWIGLIALTVRRIDFGLFFWGITLGFITLHVIAIFGSRHKIPLDAVFMMLMPVAVSWVCEACNRRNMDATHETVSVIHT